MLKGTNKENIILILCINKGMHFLCRKKIETNRRTSKRNKNKKFHATQCGFEAKNALKIL